MRDNCHREHPFIFTDFREFMSQLFSPYLRFDHFIFRGEGETGQVFPAFDVHESGFILHSGFQRILVVDVALITHFDDIIQGHFVENLNKAVVSRV